MRSKWRILSSLLFLVVLISTISLGVTQANSHNDFSRSLTNPRLIQCGRYIVTAIGNCAGCHSPNKSPDDQSG
jgi:mono/diheme cytochrome c family protein